MKQVIKELAIYPIIYLSLKKWVLNFDSKREFNWNLQVCGLYWDEEEYSGIDNLLNYHSIRNYKIQLAVLINSPYWIHGHSFSFSLISSQNIEFHKQYFQFKSAWKIFHSITATFVNHVNKWFIISIS